MFPCRIRSTLDTAAGLRVNRGKREDKWVTLLIPVGSSPEQFSAHVKSEIARWRKLVKDEGLSLK